MEGKERKQKASVGLGSEMVLATSASPPKRYADHHVACYSGATLVLLNVGQSLFAANSSLDLQKSRSHSTALFFGMRDPYYCLYFRLFRLDLPR